MQSKTIIVTNNNVNPVKEICVCDVNTLAEPPLDETTSVDYDTLSAAEKIQFDDCVTMILSKIPA
jgi:hypothetical protein